MRPTARRQSALRAPLNDILATEANVRILRALAEARAPMTAGELARRTVLQRSSVHRALEALERTGVVGHVGTGPRSQVELSAAHPLVPAIEALFAAERARAESLLAQLRDLAAALHQPPRAVWLDREVARGSDAPGDPVVVFVLDGASTLQSATERMRAVVEELERRFDVTVEVRGVTPADLEAMPADEQDRLVDALPLAGVPPTAAVKRLQDAWRTRNVLSHADHDARGLALATAVADRLVRDPSLLARAREHIARRLQDASPGERHELEEWARLLRTASPARLRSVLVDPGERSTRLRQTLPFLGVLSSTEREDAFAAASGTVSRAAAKPPRGRASKSTRKGE